MQTQSSRGCSRRVISHFMQMKIYTENLRFVMMPTMSSWVAPQFVIAHYIDVIMGAIASQITSLTIVYSTVYWVVDQRKRQSSASLAFVRWNPRVTGEFPTLRASNVENVSIWWRHHVQPAEPPVKFFFCIFSVMMTSWHGNAFRIAGSLYGETLARKGSTIRIFDVFFVLIPNGLLTQQSICHWFGTQFRSHGSAVKWFKDWVALKCTSPSTPVNWGCISKWCAVLWCWPQAYHARDRSERSHLCVG